MLDYKYGIDYGFSSLIGSDKNIYSLSFSVFNGYLFIQLPIEKQKIDTDKIKQRSFLLENPALSSLNVKFYWSMFQNTNNIDESYNSLIGMLFQMKDNQLKIMYFSINSSSFTSTTVINTDQEFLISPFVVYNSTLIYTWGANLNLFAW